MSLEASPFLLIGVSTAPVTFVDSETEAMAHVARRRAAGALR
jgi:hypothetical protein